MTQKKYKLCRRLGANIYEKCQTPRFAQSEPVKKGKKSGGRRSDFGNQLIEKQKVRFMYGVREKQFSNYVAFAMKHAHKGVTPAEILFRKLEERLDNVVYRLGFAHTRALARQMVSHGHITVNGRRNTIPSHQVKVGDVIAIREGSKSTKLFTGIEETLAALPPSYVLVVDPKTLKAEVKAEVREAEGMFDTQKVLEYYSR